MVSCNSIYQVLLSIMNNLYTHVQFQISNNNNLSKWLNSSIWPIDWILTSTTTPGQSEPESTGNEEVFHISQTLRWEPNH